MEPAFLILLGAVFAHISGAVMELGRRRLDRQQRHVERRLAFRTEHLLGLQSALFVLLETTRQARSEARRTNGWTPATGSGAQADRLAIHAALVRRSLVLIDDAGLRGATEATLQSLLAAAFAPSEAESDAAWADGNRRLTALNEGVGARVRVLSCGDG